MEREETDSVDNAGIVDNKGTMGGEAVTIEDGKDEDTGKEESIHDSGEDIGIEGTGGRVGDTDEDKAVLPLPHHNISLKREISLDFDG